MANHFSVGPFGDILMVRVKVLEKIKDKTRCRRNISKKLTGDEKSATKPGYHAGLSYQNILDLSTKTLIQNFFEIFVKKCHLPP